MNYTLLRPVVVALVFLFTAIPVDGQSRRTENRLFKGAERIASKMSTVRYRPDIVVRQARVDEGWQNASQVRSLYDGEDLALRFFDTWNADAEAWEPQQRSQFAVSSGAILSDAEWVMIDGQWRPFSKTDYALSEGLVTAYTDFMFQDGSWIPAEQGTYTLSGELTVGALFRIWDGTSWIDSERVRLEESATGVTETWESAAPGFWVPTERYVYPGRNVADLQTAWLAVQDEMIDLDGLMLSLRLPDYSFDYHDGSAWQPQERQTTDRTYDIPSGALTAEVIVTEEHDGSDWVPTGRSTVEYRVLGSARSLPTALHFESGDGVGGFFPVLTESYDAREDIGKITSATLSVDTPVGVYELEIVRFNWLGLATSVDDPATPVAFQLDQNYPNPFNPQTLIAWSLPAPATVELEVFDALGRRVATLASGPFAAGDHEVTWLADGLPGGVYLYRLTAGSASVTRAMTLLK
ncbi:MAG: T9SS type A sorting domain-containing protein [Rhodothermales bacterium]|nr:T9SS type A sorting domain-containing protein [Rhodothermales bacterium]